MTISCRLLTVTCLADAEQHLQLTVTPSGVTVALEGRLLNGSDPVASSLRRLPPDPGEQTLYLFFSPLLGYGVGDFARRLGPGSALILVELDRRLADLQHHRESEYRSPLPRSVQYARTAQEALRCASRLIQRYALRRVVTVYLSGGVRLHADQYRLIAESVQNVIQRYWSNRGTQIRLGRRWIANLLRNALLEAKNIEFFRKEAGTKAILVGAGPNLDRHIAYLENTFRADAPHGTLLVALDTALPALAAATIKPDIVVSMDSQLANVYDFMPWCWDDTVLFADITVHPGIPGKFPAGQRAFFASEFTEESILLREPILRGVPLLPARGSVAPAALELLVRYLGIRTVISVGIDFWYRSPRSHARMTGPDRRMRAAMTRLQYNDGYPSLLSRPASPVRLRDGAEERGDRILSDHAQQMEQAVRDLCVIYPDLELYTPDTEGLATGFLYRNRILENADLASVGAEAEKRGPTFDVSPDGHRLVATRVEALRELRARMDAQVAHLERYRQDETRPLFFDAGLDFTLLDMPQWPLITTRQEWFQMHHAGVLRSVRDYRRRLDRAILVYEQVTPRESL
jgi:hypothetical protein